MEDAIAHRYRTASTAAKMDTTPTKACLFAFPWYNPSNRFAMVVIITRFPNREIHCINTLPAMYRLLSLTVSISRLLIIMFAHPLFIPLI